MQMDESHNGGNTNCLSFLQNHCGISIMLASDEKNISV